MVKAIEVIVCCSKPTRKPYISLPPSTNIREPETLTRHDTLFLLTPSIVHVTKHKGQKKASVEIKSEPSCSKPCIG